MKDSNKSVSTYQRITSPASPKPPASWYHCREGTTCGTQPQQECLPWCHLLLPNPEHLPPNRLSITHPLTRPSQYCRPQSPFLCSTHGQDGFAGRDGRDHPTERGCGTEQRPGRASVKIWGPKMGLCALCPLCYTRRPRRVGEDQI